jgi:hypothetical protein
MRKILLATTALVGVAFAGAAHAAPASTSPITLNVGGYVDAVAGFYHEAESILPSGASQRGTHDFETEFKLNFDAMGKASNGVEYGANISLWNGAEATTSVPFSGGGNTVTLNSAYVWTSGAFGKFLAGDEHGASDLFVYAPTVGEGQVDGRYQDFVDPRTLARFQPSGIDNTEHSTKITYYTPKVGNDNNKVQLGVSYIPNLYDYGQNVVKYNNAGVTSGTAVSPYQDVVKGAVQYAGNFRPVNVVASGQIINGNSSHSNGSSASLLQFAPTGVKAQDFTAWGLGTQVGFNGFTVGASYTDLGRYDTVHGQNKQQDIYSAGVKYEFDKVGVAANYLGGRGYDNLLSSATDHIAGASTNSTNYVKHFNGYGAGATYTWFPGLTSNVDGVLFDQKVSDQNDHNDGYVLLVSQKLTF